MFFSVEWGLNRQHTAGADCLEFLHETVLFLYSVSTRDIGFVVFSGLLVVVVGRRKREVLGVVVLQTRRQQVEVGLAGPGDRQVRLSVIVFNHCQIIVLLVIA